MAMGFEKKRCVPYQGRRKEGEPRQWGGVLEIGLELMMGDMVRPSAMLKRLLERRSGE